MYPASWCLHIITVIEAIISTKFHWCLAFLRLPLVSHLCCVVVLQQISSLQLEANELPLNPRKKKLTLQNITKLESTPDNPPSSHLRFRALFCSRQNPLVIPTLGVRVTELLLDTRVQFKCVDKSYLITCCSLAPQTSRIRDIGTKSDLSPDLFKSKLIELASRLWWFSMNLYRCFWSWRSSCCSCHVKPKTSHQASTKHLIYLLSGSSWHLTCAEHHIVRCSWWIPHTIETNAIHVRTSPSSSKILHHEQPSISSKK